MTNREPVNEWQVGKNNASKPSRVDTLYCACRRVAALWIAVMLWCGYVSAAGKNLRSEIVRIDSTMEGLKLALHHEFVPSPRGPQRRIVLFAEGSTVPTSGNAAYKMDSLSWMDDLAGHGFDVWSLDYLGLGDSSRYPDTTTGPKGTASECAEQLATAVRYILKERRVDKLAVIGDSFGTLVAGVFAAKSPELLDRLILFAPVTPVTQPNPADVPRTPNPELLLDQPTLFAPATLVAEPKADDISQIANYDLVSTADFAQLYSSWLPPGASTGINGDFFTSDWGLKYLDTDPESRHRNPPRVMVPSGPGVDLAQVSAGNFPYDPAKIKVPTMIIYGEWDAIATEAGGKRLFDELAGAPRKTRFIIGHGTHLLQFEQVRFEAYAAVRAFLEAGRDTYHRPSR